MVGGIIPGVAHRRPATSTCSVVSTPKMEDEAYRLRTMALLLTVMGPCSGITADMVAEVVEHGQGFPRRDICVAPCFPEDFLLVLSECHQHDLVFERRQLVAAGVKLLLRPWFPPPGGNRVWRFYCRVAIEGLPLNAWSWDNVQGVIGPDFNAITGRDVARSRRSLPEGTPSEQGREGPHFPVLIHLDVVKDYTPVEDEDLEWPRIYEHKDWKMGSKDGERRARAAVSDGYAPPARRNDDDADDRYNGGARRRGKRSGACDGFGRHADVANRRDATVRAPAPRRYTRHDGAAALKARVLGPPTVAKQHRQSEEAPALPVAPSRNPSQRHQEQDRTKVFANPSLQTVQTVGSKDHGLQHEPEDNIIDALSVTNALVGLEDHAVSPGSVGSDHQQTREDVQGEGTDAQWIPPG
ncbi:hypothetical protein ZWY2020_028148 [Hordeum vulgare]|nr:hypothetical protein ZWY2020_028148 [Hordeum vulgare]